MGPTYITYERNGHHIVNMRPPQWGDFNFYIENVDGEMVPIETIEIGGELK